MKFWALLGVGLALILAWGPAGAVDQPLQPQEQEPLRGIVLLLDEQTPLEPGQERVALLVVGINPGFHLNGPDPPLDWLKPTRLQFEDHPQVKVESVQFPEPAVRQFPFADKPLPIYEKMLIIRLGLKVDPEAAAGQVRLRARLEFQACTDKVCLEPSQRELSLILVVAAPGQGGGAAPQAGSPGQPREDQEPGPWTGRLWWLLLSTFLGGLALNLTPCVYPLIPITLAYFTGQSRTRSGLLALCGAYLLGLMATYTALGLAAALSGQILGAALQHPAVLVGVALILLALAGSMFGLYEFRLPGRLTRLGQAGAGRRGWMGSLFMGLTLGLVAAPCLGPFTLGVLTFVAQRGDPWLGTVVFASLSLGLGLPLAVLGFFSTSLSRRLPASGPWLVWIRGVLGAVLVILTLYLLRPLFGEAAWHWLIGLAAAAAAGWTYLSGRAVWRPARLGLGLAWLVLAGFFFAPLTQPLPAAWPHYSPQALEQARGRPAVIKFQADWCAPCRVLEKYFQQPEVLQLLEGVAHFKVDLTEATNEANQAVARQYLIRGVPTVAFLDTEGREIEELRLVGLAGPEELVRRLSRLLELSRAGEDQGKKPGGG